MTSVEEGHSLALDYDNVMSYIGQFGKFQKKVFFLMWLVSAAGGLAVVVFSFTGYKQNYRCPVTECGETLESSFYSGSLSSEDSPLLPKWTDKDTINSCNRAEVDLTTCTFIANTTTQCDPSSLIYDSSIMSNTVVQDYQFVCDDYYKRTIYSAIYMLGMLVGSYFFGWFSDTFGRMKALMLAIVLVSLSGFLGAFCTSVTSVHGYGFLRFITGMGGIGCFMVCFVLAVEYVGFKFTMLIGIAIEIPFAMGELLLGVEAYFIRDWTTLQMVAYLPLLALVGLWWFVPESPRWLLSQGRTEEAATVIRNMAEVNGRPSPEHLFKQAELGGKVDKAEKKENISALDLFRPTNMALRTINMCFQWFSVTMCYYGLSFASTSFSGDAFSNFCLSVFIEIPGYIFCLVVMDSWGRRPILSFCQGISGIACILTGFLQGIPSVTWLQIVMSLIGKFMASASFAIVYVYTAEMFPTSVRNQAVGTCSLVARIGGICSILLGLIDADYPNYPVIIMGIVACTAGGLAILFPETLGQKLPDTMEEAFRIGEDNKRPFFSWTKVNFGQMFKEDLKQVPTDGFVNLDLNKD